jgi:hypothetical protein
MLAIDVPRSVTHSLMEVTSRSMALLVALLACSRPTPTSEAPPSGSAEVRAHDTAAHEPVADPATDFAFLGPRDDALVQRLHDETALVGAYLVAASQDGELSVADDDVEPLLEYSRALLQAHAGEASARILRGDGQRYLRAAWLGRRAEEAAAGHASLVRIPIEACVGWGCEVPSEFVAVDCFGPAAFFVIPTGDDARPRACLQCLGQEGEARAECEPSMCHFFVEGWFTGRREEAQGEGCGAGWEFHVARSDEGPDPGFQILVPAGGPPPQAFGAQGRPGAPRVR